MSGPLTSAVFFLLSLALLLAPPQRLEAKPLSSSRGGGRSLEGTGRAMRFRRELRDALPYEAQMMSYAQVPGMEGQGNELYYQPDGWRGQGLEQALQRLVEDDRRKDQEAAYLAGLLRLLKEGENNAQRANAGQEEEEEEGGDLQGPYPSDYDETDQGINMAKPQATWQGLLDPQLTQALLNRYRQERLQQTGLPPSNRVQESMGDPGADEREEEVLRYLIGRVLSSLAPDSPQSPSARLPKWDLGQVNGAVGGSTALKRSRRSLDSAPVLSSEPSLLRVKRLEDEEEEQMAGGPAGGVNQGTQVGLQRMKRIDSDLQQGKHSRKRRALPYNPNLLAQRILQYLAE